MTSREMRRLTNKWKSGQGWPKRVEWIEVNGIRGWSGQRIDFAFPMVAIVGENGVGKTTILQSLASVYRAPAGRRGYFPTDFFPDTPWEITHDASIKWSVRESETTHTDSVRKRLRWRGYDVRRERSVEFIDLRRSQPVASRVGYAAIAKPKFRETTSEEFDFDELNRIKNIMGRDYDLAKESLTTADDKRAVYVLSVDGREYSGFHQGAGEVALMDLLTRDLPKNSLVLIDEIETSLHPRAQRRLIRDFAQICRLNGIQIVFTTHSPYVLDELPVEGRIYVMNTPDERRTIMGVSPFFAMTMMDTEQYPECDLYVEDDRAAMLLRETLIAHSREVITRCQIIPFGAASVGIALGQMAIEGRFPRPSLVFLDGDQEVSAGCLSLPGDDAPERVVFERLAESNWPTVPDRVGRRPSEVIDACRRAMTLSDHHEWVTSAADDLTLGADTLWQACTAAWAVNCMTTMEAASATEPVLDAINSP